MTNEQFDLAMKRFFRCMKENGYYWRVKRYILPPGRTRNDLLNDINDKSYDTTFSRLLLYLNLLGQSYEKFERIEPGYWSKYISQANNIWFNECSKKYPEYLHRL